MRDTKDTIRLLESIDYYGDYLLVTADMAALYTCIPRYLGFAAVKHYLSRDILPWDQQDYIMKLLEFATKHNYFWLDNTFYLQQRGVWRICLWPSGEEGVI